MWIAALAYECASNPRQPAPVITPEVTASLEEIIKRRIKEESWDDPVRKVELDRPFKPQVVLDEEKSKKGLGEIYEEEARTCLSYDLPCWSH